MKQTLEDYIRQDANFRQALLDQEGGIMKYWALHPDAEFDIDLFNGYENEIVKVYLQANKRNRALHSLPDDKLKWDALSWYHHERGKELKFYTELRPELDKLPKEVKEQADGYFVDYLEDNYREYLRYAYSADIAPIDFYNKVIRVYGVGGLARDCMDYILKDHHHPEVWSKMKSVDVVMTEFYIEEYSAFIIKERCFKKLRQGVKEKLAGKNQDECRREAVKMMNSVKGFARMLYSSSETQITDCTGDYKVDKRWLRGQTEGLTADFRRDGYLKNSFSEYVGILNDIGRIWAARLLKDHGIDMHELEKETGAILYPVAEPAQNPDGLDHGKYKYYVDKELSDPLDDQCCIYDENQAKELLDALRRKNLAEKRGEDAKKPEGDAMSNQENVIPTERGNNKAGNTSEHPRPGRKKTCFKDYVVIADNYMWVTNLIKEHINRENPKQVALVVCGGIEAGIIRLDVSAPSIEEEFGVKGGSVKSHLTQYRSTRDTASPHFSKIELEPFKKLFTETE